MSGKRDRDRDNWVARLLACDKCGGQRADFDEPPHNIEDCMKSLREQVADLRALVERLRVAVGEKP